jgi:endogenous inhibitor of DNA gyrase (YacG/DUF329 family)
LPRTELNITPKSLAVIYTASLAEDTLPLFRSDDFEIEDWAANNMNWSDVQYAARCVSAGDDVDFGEWVNGDKEVKEAAEEQHRQTGAA